MTTNWPALGFCAFLCATGIALADLELKKVDPPQIFVDEAATLTLTGDGIDPGAWLAVLDGGPYVAGTLDFPGQFPGAMARIDERYVAVATHRALHVVDLSEPGSPVSSGVRWIPSAPISAAADGDLVVVGDWRHWVLVYDVSDRAAPALVGSAQTLAAPTRVELSGSNLYVGSGREFRFWCLAGAFETFSLADPANPVPLASMELPVCVRGMGMSDENTLHLLTQDNEAPRMKLINLDVSEPSAPVELSRLAWPNPDTHDWTGLTVDGGIGYVVQEYPSLLRTVDLRDPADPGMLFQGPAPVQRFRQTAASDGMLLVGSEGVRLFDVRNPAAPRILGREQVPSFGGLEAAGHLALAIGYLWENPLSVVDTAVPVRPVAEVVHEGVPGGVKYLFRGTIAFAADTYVGVHVLDLAEPDAPRLIDTITDPRSVDGIALDGDTLYLTDSWFGEVEAYDVSDPAAIKQLSVLRAGRARDITAISGFVFATDNRNNGVRFFDFRDPSIPAEVGFVPLAFGRPQRIERSADGTHVYAMSVQTSPYGDLGALHVLDVSEPAAPRVAGVVTWPGHPKSLVVHDGLVWLADEDVGVVRVDVSDPRRPTSRVALAIPNALGIARFDRWLAVSSGSLGSVRTEVRVWDVTDLEDPRLHQQHPLDRVVFRLHAFGDGLLFDRDELSAVTVPPPPAAPRPSGPRTWTTVLPPGRPAGPYDVLVRNPDGSSSRLRNALRICERRDVVPALEPIVDSSRPVLLPVRWRLSVNEPGLAAEGAVVSLPAIDPAVSPAFVPATGPDTIEIRTFEDGRPAGVALLGADEARLRERWRLALDNGGPALPRLDGDRFGDVLLDQRRQPLDGSLHRFVLRPDGRLDAASAVGPEPELRFEAVVSDEIDCRFVGETTLTRTMQELCDRLGPSATCVTASGPRGGDRWSR